MFLLIWYFCVEMYCCSMTKYTFIVKLLNNTDRANHMIVQQTAAHIYLWRIYDTLNDFIGLLGPKYPTIMLVNTTIDITCSFSVKITTRLKKLLSLIFSALLLSILNSVWSIRRFNLMIQLDFISLKMQMLVKHIFNCCLRHSEL